MYKPLCSFTYATNAVMAYIKTKLYVKKNGIRGCRFYFLHIID